MSDGNGSGRATLAALGYRPDRPPSTRAACLTILVVVAVVVVSQVFLLTREPDGLGVVSAVAAALPMAHVAGLAIYDLRRRRG